MKLNNFKHKMFLLVIVLFITGSFIDAKADTLEFMVKKGIFQKDKVWRITFNVPAEDEALKKVKVYSDYVNKELVEGIKVTFEDNDKRVILVEAPVGGFKRGDNYIEIDSGITSSNNKFKRLDKKIIIKFIVESNTLSSVETKKDVFKHHEVKEELRQADSWIKLNKDSQTYDLKDEINMSNIENLKSMFDIFSVDELDASQILEKLKSYKFSSSKMYNDNGQGLNSSFYKQIKENTNMENVVAMDKPQYGIVTTKSDLRAFPTEVEFHRKRGDKFDRIQETALEAGEGVLILHTSTDKMWYFVQAQNYYGWIQSKLVGKTSKEEAKSFIEAKDFIVILEDRVQLISDEENLFYSMGVKLPVVYDDGEKLMVGVPGVDDKGNLKKITAYVENIDYSRGYLPLNRENIIKQAFKLQGTLYSWGDKGTGRDCSSTLMSIYRTMGIYLPRNTDQQEISYGEKINLSGKNRQSRYESSKSLMPGDILFLNGHEAMYIGEYQGRGYILHNFTGTSVKESGDKGYTEVFRVSVTPMDMLSGGGTSYINLYTSFLKILND